VISDDGGSTALLAALEEQEGRDLALEGELARASRLPCGRCRTCLSCSVVVPGEGDGAGLAEVFRTRIDSLSEALGREDTRAEAAQVVGAIEIDAQGGELAMVLRC